jgi:hypothetical protein
MARRSVYRQDVDPATVDKPAPAAERIAKAHEYETKFLELAAWYEWATPPQLEAACALQDAADAVRCHALSYEAADVLLAIWQPFAGLEAQVGHPPKLRLVEPEPDGELAMLRQAVTDLGQMVDAAKTPEERDRLKVLMREQVAIYQRAQNGGTP